MCLFLIFRASNILYDFNSWNNIASKGVIKAKGNDMRMTSCRWWNKNLSFSHEGQGAKNGKWNAGLIKSVEKTQKIEIYYTGFQASSSPSSISSSRRLTMTTKSYSLPDNPTSESQSIDEENTPEKNFSLFKV